eukprot:m.596745 g.596745  ORF g.596745 m.596745 type:complete len:60 (+) comp22415_c0_seq4:1163-1342(+)
MVGRSRAVLQHCRTPRSTTTKEETAMGNANTIDGTNTTVNHAILMNEHFQNVHKESWRC